MDSHIGSQRFLTSLSAHGSYFENLGESTLVDVRVILLVEDDKMDEYIHPIQSWKLLGLGWFTWVCT
jgi:hypothetical protein